MTSRETDLNKQESSAAADHRSTTEAAAAAAPSSAWSRVKDPRIVRVSKAFGGKDRHSKVCTVRGLRDRRMRLSVPTAIQLYDLQDRLGLSQPSKVVDWLLNAAKHEIDELPPLEFPPGSFQAMAERSGQAWTDPHMSGFLEGKEASDEEGNEREEASWGRNSGENDQNVYVSDNSFARQGLSMLNSSIPYNSLLRWDPSNLSLSHPPRSDAAVPDHDWHSIGLVPMSVAASGSHQQLLVYQPGITTQSYFQATNSEEMSLRGNNETTSAHQTFRPVQFATTANLLNLHNDVRDDEHKARI